MSQLPPGGAVLHMITAEPPPQPPREARVPPRIQVAMAFLRDLSMKTQEVSVQTSEFGSTTQPAQELTEHEKDTCNVALDTLDRYFAGTLKESPWDRPRRRKRQKVAVPAGAQVPTVREADAKRDGLPLLTIPCPACNLHGRLQPVPKRQHPDCEVCGNQRIVAIARVERSK